MTIINKVDNYFYFNIANLVIALNFENTEPASVGDNFRVKLLNLYKGFIISKPKRIDYYIFFKQIFELDVLIKKKEKSHYINFFKQFNKKRIETYYHLSDDQFKIVLRTVIQILLSDNKGVIMHASAVLINGKACVFMAKSGGGKSTIMKILSKKYQPLADDSIILRIKNKKIIFFQSPFIEKNYWFAKSSQKLELGKIFFLSKASNHSVERIIDREIIVRPFLEQAFTEAEDANIQLKLVLELASKFDQFYNLKFSQSHHKSLIRLIEKV